MRFEIREEGVEGGETLQVVYSGGVPSTFGDGVVAILKGTVTEEGVLESDDMITKCPSKYESAAGALAVADLADKGDAMVDKYTKVTGVVVADTIVPPGEETRFLIASEDGAAEIGVAFEGALPAGMDTGSVVVVSGKLGTDRHLRRGFGVAVGGSRVGPVFRRRPARWVGRCAV